MSTKPKTSVALTLGDAAGIGPELLAKALSTTTVPEHTAWVIVGCGNAREFASYRTLIKDANITAQ